MPIDAFVAKSHILHRALAYEPQKIVSGSGISFTLQSGKVVIDASAGPSVSGTFSAFHHPCLWV